MLSRSPRVDPLQHWLPRLSLRAVNLGSARLVVPAPLPGVTSMRVEVTLCRWSSAAFAPPVGIASSLMGRISVFSVGGVEHSFTILFCGPWCLLYTNRTKKQRKSEYMHKQMSATHTNTLCMFLLGIDHTCVGHIECIYNCPRQQCKNHSPKLPKDHDTPWGRSARRSRTHWWQVRASTHMRMSVIAQASHHMQHECACMRLI